MYKGHQALDVTEFPQIKWQERDISDWLYCLSQKDGPVLLN